MNNVFPFVIAIENHINTVCTDHFKSQLEPDSAIGTSEYACTPGRNVDSVARVVFQVYCFSI